MNPELLAYLLANCSADIHLHCGPAGQPAGLAFPNPTSDYHHHQHGCPQPCPEVDYSNPNQPYFWDHEEMN